VGTASGPGNKDADRIRVVPGPRGRTNAGEGGAGADFLRGGPAVRSGSRSTAHPTNALAPARGQTRPNRFPGPERKLRGRVHVKTSRRFLAVTPPPGTRTPVQGRCLLILARGCGLGRISDCGPGATARITLKGGTSDPGVADPGLGERVPWAALEPGLPPGRQSLGGPRSCLQYPGALGSHRQVCFRGKGLHRGLRLSGGCAAGGSLRGNFSKQGSWRRARRETRKRRWGLYWPSHQLGR